MDEIPPRRSRPPAWLAALLVLLAGLGGGYGLHALLSQPVEVVISEPEIVKQELTDEQLAEVCSDLTADDRQHLSDAQQKVETLRQQLDSKEGELAELRRQAAADESRRTQAARKWQQMKKHIAELERQVVDLQERLHTAEQQRDDALDELRETVKELDHQIKATEQARAQARKYRKESHENLWAAFVAQAKVDICDRGTRHRHAKCHEAVEEALGQEIQARFIECVETWQAVPALVRAERHQELPQYAEWMNEDSRFTRKNWYIQYCDPTLPEAHVGDDGPG